MPGTDIEQDSANTRLAGKHCLITAAGAGIGRATAIAFAHAGADVLATDIDVAALDMLRKEAPAIQTAMLDVTCIEQAASLIERNPVFDVLFNCAGYVHSADILNTDEADWRRSFSINVDAMFYLCKAVLPGMLERGFGSIINMSSVVSSVKGAPNRFAYGATKAAVIGMTKAIAVDYAARGIRCNAICPGTVASPSLNARVAAQEGDQAAVWRSFVERQPMGRLGHTQEIAALALYLASDDASFTTGTIHVIDGGWSA